MCKEAVMPFTYQLISVGVAVICHNRALSVRLQCSPWCIPPDRLGACHPRLRFSEEPFHWGGVVYARFLLCPRRETDIKKSPDVLKSLDS